MPYLVCVNWERFQHYKDRDPVWIKNYLELLRKDEYLDLSGHRRSVLHGLWLVYASKHARVRLDTRSLSRQLQLRVTTADIDAIVDAGFFEVSASNVLAEPEQNGTALKAEAEKERAIGKAKIATPRDAVQEPPRGRHSLGAIDERYFAVEALIGVIPGVDAEKIRFEAGDLPAASVQKVRESVQAANGVRNLAGYAVNALRSERKERTAA